MKEFKKKIFTFILNQNVKIDDDVFSYGFDIVMSYFLYLSFLIPLAMYFKIEFEVFEFLLIFIPMRKYLGGFHFENNILCLVFSLITTLIIPLIARELGVISLKFQILLMIVYIFLINIFGVADCKKKKLNNSDKRHYLHNANILLMIYSLILVIFHDIIPSNYTNIILITVFIVNINLMFAKIKRIYGN